MKLLPPVSVAIHACLYALAANEVQLLPAGEFSARDGRPGKGRTWKLSDADGRALAQRLNARTTPLVIDYEHQTLNTEDNGQPAPAAGWAQRFEWRDGLGLFATEVQWTDRAKAHIQAGEYRFVSPVFLTDRKTDAVLDLMHAALVNTPALDGMAEVAERMAARFSTSKENTMLAKLLAALGLPADGTEDSALTAAAALKARADEASTKCETAQRELTALKSAATKTDAVSTEAMQALQKQVGALTTQLAQRDLDEVIAAALQGGKLVPAQEKWARDLGAKDLAGLKNYIETSPGVIALHARQSGDRGAPGAGNATELANKAKAYIAEQARNGITVNAAQAVAAVSR